jgi:hypothetical protein
LDAFIADKIFVLRAIEKMMDGKSPKRYTEKIAEVPLDPTKKITLSQGTKFEGNIAYLDNNMVLYNKKPLFNFTSLNYEGKFKQSSENLVASQSRHILQI